MKRQETFNIKGMRKDIAESLSTNEYAFDLQNIRFTIEDNNTYLRLNNEKLYTISNGMIGKVLGVTKLNNYLVIFSRKANGDNAIVKYDINNNLFITLYEGPLNINNEIECIPYYENEEIQKVYWVDGKNQLRCIDITNTYDTSDTFEVSNDILDIQYVNISKDADSAYGSFPSGTVQYVFTGVNYYGSESNISFITPLYYTSKNSELGGNPEYTNSNIFNISVSLTDVSNYEYLRVYSIIRTSINGIPIVKHLKDIEISGSGIYSFVDDNSTGQSLDPTDLYYLGSKLIIPETITVKDNTLFLGNYKVEHNTLKDIEYTIDDSTYVFGKNNIKEYSIIRWNKYYKRVLQNAEGVFPYKSNLDGNSYNITHFKKGEWYRFGLMFQFKNGDYSEVIHIEDSQCPHSIKESSSNINNYYVPYPTLIMNGYEFVFKKWLIENNIINIIPVIVYTNENDCSIIAQGVCNPTVYNVEDRANNTPFSQPSWFFRPYPPFEMYRETPFEWNVEDSNNLYKGISFGENSRFEKLFNKDLLNNKKHTYFGFGNLGEGRIASEIQLYYFNDDYSKISKGGIVDSNGYIYPNKDNFNSDSEGLYDYFFYDESSKINGYAYPVASDVYNTNVELDDIINNIKINPLLNAINNILPIGIITYKDIVVYSSDISKMGSVLEFRHDFPIPPCTERNGEIQSNYIWPYIYTKSYKYGDDPELNYNCYTIATPFLRIDSNFIKGGSEQYVNPWFNISYNNKEEYLKFHKHTYFIDHNIITFHSPEIEFNDSFYTKNLENYKFRVIGIVPIHSNVTDYDIIPEKGPMNFAGRSDFPKGFIKEELGKIDEVDLSTDSYLGNSHLGYRGLCSTPVWEDDIEGRVAPYDCINDRTKDLFTALKTRYVIYPWHSEFLNNGKNTGLLKYKIFCNNRYSYNSVYFDNYTECNTKDIIISNPTYKLNYFKSSYKDDSVYYGTDIDKLIIPNFENNPIIKNFDGYPIIISGQESLGNTRQPAIGWTSKITPDTLWIDSFRIDSDKIDENTWCTGITVPNKYFSAYKNNLFSGKYRPLYKAISNNIDIVNDLSIFTKWYTRDGSSGSYTITQANNIAKRIFGFTTYDDEEDKNIDIKDELLFSINPSRIKYKTSPHALISFGKSYYNHEWYLDLLPKLLKGDNNLPFSTDTQDASYHRFPIDGCKYFWLQESDNCLGSMQRYINDDEEFNYTTKYGYLVLGELYRDVNKDLLFGGDSDNSLENNKWIIAGNPIKVIQDTIEPDLDVELIKWEQGDFYYQRYNHTLAYPAAQEDKNSIVDTLSFMVETRINIDGVYSEQKAPFKSWVNFENTNKLNQVYSQANNFYSYSAVNPIKLQIEYFPNSVTWTQPKIAGSLKDNWLNIQVANTLDLEGQYGKLNKLITYNDTILSFQDTAISSILYNERIQISPSDNIPIEIANSGRVDGYKILDDIIGCTNKFTICKTKTGIYFVYNNSIYNIGGSKNITSISKAAFMDSWCKKNNIIRTIYNDDTGDVYFNTENTSLAYNELLNTFTSFYPNYKNFLYMYKKIYAVEDDYINTSSYNILNQLDINSCYDSIIEVISGGGTTQAEGSRLSDKIFDYIEFYSESDVRPTETYNYLQVRNEYQDTGNILLSDVLNRPSNLKRRFRKWYITIPRDSSNNRDRIRSPWTFVKLERRNNDNNPNIYIQGLTVNYFD